MTQFLLAAISHEHTDGTNGRLISQTSAIGFKAQVEPLITSNSLILCEGIFTYGLVYHDHPYYENLHTELFELPSSKRPTFVGLDSRGEDSGLSPQEMANKLDLWEATVKRLVVTDWGKKPKTLTQAVEWIKNDTSAAYLAQQPKKDEVELARWVSEQNKKFDRLYLKAMRHYGSTFDTCVLVAGAIHALALTLEADYTLVELVAGEHVANAYEYYLATHRFAELFFEAP